MMFKSRLAFLIRSQLNHMITMAEDPVKILNHAMDEIDAGLVNARATIESLRSRVGRDERSLQRLEKQISFWGQRAEEYVKDDMEQNAREAIRVRRFLAREDRAIRLRHTEELSKVKDMKETLRVLESRALLAKAKRDTFVKHIGFKTGIKTDTDKLIDFGFWNDIKEPFDMFRRVEEKVGDEGVFNYLTECPTRGISENEEDMIDEEIAKIKKRMSEEKTDDI